MKLKHLFLALWALTPLWATEAFNLSYETFSIDSILDPSGNKKLELIDPGHHKTVITIQDLPQSSSYVLRVKRPIFKNREVERVATLEDMLGASRYFGAKTPLFFISSLSFLPGEEIEFLIETKDKKHKSKPLRLCPNPLIAEIPKSHLKMTAKLVSILEGGYLISLEGFKEGEKLTLHSVSGDEVIESDLNYSDNFAFFHLLAVIGMNGGVGTVSFIRENGEKLSLNLPWGDEHFEHLAGKRAPAVSYFTKIAH